MSDASTSSRMMNGTDSASMGDMKHMAQSGNGMMMMMMTMTFNFKLPFHLLFQSIEIRYQTDLLIACIFMGFLGMFYEWIKSVRVKMMDPKCCLYDFCRCLCQHSKKKSGKYVTKLIQRNDCICPESIKEITPSHAPEEAKETISQRKRSWSSIRVHIVETILHGIQLFVSYVIMLAVMTYNVPIVCSVILGCVIGYFVSNWPHAKKRNKQQWRKEMMVRQTDCH